MRVLISFVGGNGHFQPMVPVARAAVAAGRGAVRRDGLRRDGRRRPVVESPPPISTPRDVPTVYFTLGTIFNTESGDLFTRALHGLRELPAHLVMTVGGRIDPAEFGPQPSHVRIERYLPQDTVLPRCSVG